MRHVKNYFVNSVSMNDFTLKLSFKRAQTLSKWGRDCDSSVRNSEIIACEREFNDKYTVIEREKDALQFLGYNG